MQETLTPVVRARARQVQPDTRTPAATPRSLLAVFAATVAAHGARSAIDVGEHVLTYDQLSEAADRLAARLKDLGVGRGDRVGVRVPSGTVDLYVAILGVLHAGAAYVPVDADDPPARAAAVFAGAQACAVIEDGLRITSLGPAHSDAGSTTPDDDAWVIFTSGSTGAPKGVAVTHRSAAAFVEAEADLFAVSPEDRVLAGLSVGFDASCEEMWLAWRHGATLVPAPRALVRAGSELGPWLAERGVSVVSTVPTLAAMWNPADLSSVRLLILGGEACSESLAWRLAGEREVWNTYGPTEATVVSTAGRIEAGKPVTIGWPLRGWEIAVVDERGEPVALGEPGELAIGGIGVARYLDSALDAARFAPVPALGPTRAYRTGDIVRETIDGLQFIGRRDDQVKLGGRRLELGEIEAQLSAVPGVRAAAAAVQNTVVGNPVLVGYVVGEADPEAVRARLAERLPTGIVPLIVALDALPTGGAGKVDRKALPWPLPGATSTESAESLSGTATWLAERWAAQLGVAPLHLDSDFFDLGGSSLAAAKLVSELREHFPAVGISDVYEFRRLGELSARLDQLGAVDGVATSSETPRRRGWAALQLAVAFLLRLLLMPPWLLGILAIDRIDPTHIGPRLGWGWLIGGWLLFVSVPGRALLLAVSRRLLLHGLKPGRYRRHSGLMLRVWLIERLAAAWRLNVLEGTPWAARYARFCGHPVGEGARLFTLPPVASLVKIGANATIESGVDMEGWWIEGGELVIGELSVGPHARIGTMSVLMPGAQIGDGAEIEPGALVTGVVPAGERWHGSPARPLGRAGERWPHKPAPAPCRSRLWKAMYALGVMTRNLLPLVAALPGLVLIGLLAQINASAQTLGIEALTMAPVLVLTYLLSYGLLTALCVRALAPLLRPGWHPEEGPTRWALWLTDSLMEAANGVLFPLYLSVYTRWWLRLLGIRVGPQAEVSVTSGLNRLTRMRERSFAADAAVFAHARSRGGWLHVGPIDVGRGTFLGNGAIVQDDTALGSDGLIGVLTTAPRRTADGTSWFGAPALELPRRPTCIDEARTVDPPRRLVFARGAVELVRILLPSTVSVMLGALVFGAVERIAALAGLAAMAAATPFVLLAAGVCAVAVTAALKWALVGHYRAGQHPLWSFFVWRDEIINSAQEQLASAWLMSSFQATPLMSCYLRLMGAKVGRDVWCDTMTITEFDVVELGDGCVVNRFGIVEAHLFHDRLLQIGPVRIEAQATLGPISAILPDSTLGAGACVGARSVVMRGERLPAGTCWHGVPVVVAT